MPSERRPREPFDETPALAELEALRRSIERARERRKEIHAEFDDFVRGFKNPSEKQDIAPAPVSPPSSMDSLSPFPSEIDTDAKSAEPWGAATPSAAGPQSASAAVDLPAGLIPPPPEKRRRRVRWAGALGAIAAAAVITVAALLMLTWRTAPPESPSPPESSGGSRPPAAGVPAPGTPTAGAPVARTPTPAPPGRAAPAPVEAANRSPQAAVTALRRVWVRVAVDGNRVLERVLQADETVPLGPIRTVVIRTGDAGAVRLSIDGHGGPLGRDGEVVTRTFTAKEGR
jgi:hypothetical protein